eukprot:6048059-Pleurochrysis_carterae.AAC.1
MPIWLWKRQARLTPHSYTASASSFTSGLQTPKVQTADGATKMLGCDLRLLVSRYQTIIDHESNNGMSILCEEKDLLLLKIGKASRRQEP